MVKRMLMDATHPEETRVVVLDGTRLEEFDVETSTKKQIKGNIYLAKVIRVEPSLQAAFVDYGGNRHGFLAFSEIHPDYYQIPVADRERLVAEQERHEREEEERHSRRRHRGRGRTADSEPSETPGDAAAPGETAPSAATDETPAAEAADDAAFSAHAEDNQPDDDGHHDHHDDDHGDDDQTESIPLAFMPPAIASDTIADDETDEADEAEPSIIDGDNETTERPATEPAEAATDVATSEAEAAPEAGGDIALDDAHIDGEKADEKPGVETVGGDDVEEESAHDDNRRRRFLASRHYKIQEVIKRRQIMLVQVVKEERGNKGAALTTYLSLAGRYCVLMPNSARGGGVSRKITSAQDRRRLKSILGDLELPTNMGVILRTAGAERNKAEIKRDYEYLQRTWNSIREVTMSSRAPALIHEEASLIKRAIRDIYSRDIEEVWVEGEDGYKTAKDFMRMLTPSHAKKVQRYKDDIIPLFHRYQVETQMEAINSPVVQLRSGGSIVFAQTEALVAIDVNSGRATKERHIEETAYKTNIEAAEEIARQLRLRDLAGLVVIDFIDMEDNRNNHAVERRLKEALKADRARIQVGRISHFGLLELSRQRLRPSLIEANFRVCSHCAGSGMIRSTESAAVYSLRMLEEEGVRQRSSEVTITVHPDVALYLLNYKREALASIESRYHIKIFVLGDSSLVPPHLRLDRVKAMRAPGEVIEHREHAPARDMAPEQDDPEEADEAEADDEAETHEQRGHARGDEGEDGGRRRRRRRRRRRGGEDREGPRGERRPDGPRQNQQADAAPEEGGDADGSPPAVTDEDDHDRQEAAERDGDGRRRRRGRRGGRRRRRGTGPDERTDIEANADGHAEETASVGADAATEGSNAAPETPQAAQLQEHAPEVAGDAPIPGEGRNGASRFFSAIKNGVLGRRGEELTATPTTAAPAPQPAPRSPPVENTPAPIAEPAPVPSPANDEPAGPPRKGWWSGKP